MRSHIARHDGPVFTGEFTARRDRNSEVDVATSVLWRFFDAMRDWEASAAVAFGGSDEDDERAISALPAILNRYTAADGFGRERELTLQHGEPPEYDRERWTIVESEHEEDANRVSLIVIDSQPQLSERFKFMLEQTQGDWKILSRSILKRGRDEPWPL